MSGILAFYFATGLAWGLARFEQRRELLVEQLDEQLGSCRCARCRVNRAVAWTVCILLLALTTTAWPYFVVRELDR